MSFLNCFSALPAFLLNNAFFLPLWGTLYFYCPWYLIKFCNYEIISEECFSSEKNSWLVTVLCFLNNVIMIWKVIDGTFSKQVFLFSPYLGVPNHKWFWFSFLLTWQSKHKQVKEAGLFWLHFCTAHNPLKAQKNKEILTQSLSQGKRGKVTINKQIQDTFFITELWGKGKSQYYKPGSSLCCHYVLGWCS